MCEVIDVDFVNKKKNFKFTYVSAINQQKLEQIQEHMRECVKLYAQITKDKVEATRFMIVMANEHSTIKEEIWKHLSNKSYKD